MFDANEGVEKRDGRGDEKRDGKGDGKMAVLYGKTEMGGVVCVKKAETVGGDILILENEKPTKQLAMDVYSEMARRIVSDAREMERQERQRRMLNMVVYVFCDDKMWYRDWETDRKSVG